MIDRVSDRSKGFGFVTFASQDEADKAVTEMNGKVVVFFDYSFNYVLEAYTNTFFALVLILFLKLKLTHYHLQQLNGRVIFVDHAKPRARFDDGGMPVARGPPEPAASQ